MFLQAKTSFYHINTFKSNINKLIMAKTNLDDRVLEFLKADEDGISVDWKKLADFRDEQGHEGRYVFDSVSDNLIDFLIKEVILVNQDKKGSFAVTGYGISGRNIGPSYSISGTRNFNFARRSDAEAYREHVIRFYGRVVLPAQIMQVTS